MKYSSFELLNARIERIIKSTVKFYLTDWTEYDRPKYIRFAASDNKDDKKLVLIARKCGTYLVRVSDIKSGCEWSNAIYNYYQEQDPADYYFINLDKLTVSKITPSLTKTELR